MAGQRGLDDAARDLSVELSTNTRNHGSLIVTVAMRLAQQAKPTVDEIVVFR